MCILLISIKLEYKESVPAKIHAPPNYSSIGEKLIIHNDNDEPTTLRMNIT
jgi:hypothetical protein